MDFICNMVGDKQEGIVKTGSVGARIWESEVGVYIGVVEGEDIDCEEEFIWSILMERVFFWIIGLWKSTDWLTSYGLPYFFWREFNFSIVLLS